MRMDLLFPDWFEEKTMGTTHETLPFREISFSPTFDGNLASFKQYIVMGIQQQSITGPEIQVCNAHSGPIGGPIGRFSFFWGNPLLRQPGQPYFPSVFLLCSTSIHHYSMISITPGT